MFVSSPEFTVRGRGSWEGWGGHWFWWTLDVPKKRLKNDQECDSESPQVGAPVFEEAKCTYTESTIRFISLRASWWLYSELSDFRGTAHFHQTAVWFYLPPLLLFNLPRMALLTVNYVSKFLSDSLNCFFIRSWPLLLGFRALFPLGSDPSPPSSLP